jgi:hypothetical protein
MMVFSGALEVVLVPKHVPPRQAVNRPQWSGLRSEAAGAEGCASLFKRPGSRAILRPSRSPARIRFELISAIGPVILPSYAVKLGRSEQQLNHFGQARTLSFRLGRAGGHPSKLLKVLSGKSRIPMVFRFSIEIMAAVCLGGRLRGHDEREGAAIVEAEYLLSRLALVQLCARRNP